MYIDKNVKLNTDLIVGFNSDIGKNLSISSNVTIGDNVMIASECYIITANYRFNDKNMLMCI